MQQEEKKQFMGNQAPQPDETEHLVQDPHQMLAENQNAQQPVMVTEQPVMTTQQPVVVGGQPSHNHTHGSGSMWTQVSALFVKQYRMNRARPVGKKSHDSFQFS